MQNAFISEYQDLVPRSQFYSSFNNPHQFQIHWRRNHCIDAIYVYSEEGMYKSKFIVNHMHYLHYELTAPVNIFYDSAIYWPLEMQLLPWSSVGSRCRVVWSYASIWRSCQSRITRFSCKDSAAPDYYLSKLFRILKSIGIVRRPISNLTDLQLVPERALSLWHSEQVMVGVCIWIP